MSEKDKVLALKSESTVNINGEITDGHKATLSIFDRGFLYGDSIYDVTISAERSIVFLEDHIERLFRSAALIDLHVYYSREQIIEEVLRTLKVANRDHAYIRIILTRGETSITLDPSVSFSNNLIIIVKEKKIYPKKFYQEGVYLLISNTIRNHIRSVNPNAKSGNYLNNVMAMSEARKLGADDALMVNSQGEITEGTTFNVWCIKDNKIYTPGLKSGLLEGITRAKVLEIGRQHNIPIHVDSISVDFILNADEVFITSSMRGVIPVSRINDHQYQIFKEKDSFTRKIMTLYSELINNEVKQTNYKY